MKWEEFRGRGGVPRPCIDAGRGRATPRTSVGNAKVSWEPPLAVGRRARGLRLLAVTDPSHSVGHLGTSVTLGGGLPTLLRMEA